MPPLLPRIALGGLAGYSIDTPFSLLEGLNQSIEKHAAKKTAPA